MVPFPYGLSIVFIESLNEELKPLEMASSIAFLFGLQSIILSHLILPFCRSPILIVGTLKDGASKIPLDEFPITRCAYFIALKYLTIPKLNSV